MPASSPGLASSSSTLKPRFSAHRISMRSTISAQSWASVPPAPEPPLPAPPLPHAHPHPAPALGVGPPRAGVDGAQRAPLRVLAAEEPLQLEVLEPLLDPAELLGDLVGELGIGRQLLEVGDV